MKKVTFLLSAVSLAFVMSACSDKPSDNKTASSTQAAPEQKTTEETSDDSKRPDQLEAVKKLITLFKAKDVNAIAKLVNYPIKREAPLSSIKDEKEFIQKFDEIFSAEFVKNIAASQTDEWDAIGSRGTTYADAAGNVIWLADEDSKIISVFSETKAAQDEEKSTIEKGKQNLHSSLGNIKKPIYILTTKKYKVRIDQLNNGKYRYAAWNSPNADMSTQPDIIVNNGELIVEGSLNIEHYEFKNGNIRYEVWPENMASANGDANLSVYEGDKELLSHDAKIIFGR